MVSKSGQADFALIIIEHERFSHQERLGSMIKAERTHQILPDHQCDVAIRLALAAHNWERWLTAFAPSGEIKNAVFPNSVHLLVNNSITKNITTIC